MKTKGLNAFQLKLFMALLMVFDHLGKMGGDFSCFDTLCSCLVRLRSSRRVSIHTESLALQSASLFLGNDHVCWKYYSQSAISV